MTYDLERTDLVRDLRRHGDKYPAAVQDLPGCAIFEARPFCEQWDVLHGTLRSKKLAE